MGDTSSDEDMPLIQRPLGGILLAGRAAAPPPKPAAGSESESDIPSWLQAGAKGKSNQVITLTDSSSDDDAIMSPAKPAAAAQPAGNRGSQPAPVAQQQQQQQQQQAAPKSAAKPRATPGRGRVAAAAAAADEPPSGSQPLATQPSGTQPSGTQPSGTQGTAQKRAAVAAGVGGVLASSTSSMPVVLPEKLPQMKMLVELEAGGADDTHGSTDLSGDSGSIGRLVIGGTKAEPTMQIDLKGVLYNASIVPCATSLAVINMGATEAKVEALFSEFVQLREDTRFSFVDADQLGGLVGGDDDENYASAGEGGGEGGGAKKKGGAKGAGAKAAPRKRAAATKPKGGVKKAAAKPRAKPKPKAAAGAKKK